MTNLKLAEEELKKHKQEQVIEKITNLNNKEEKNIIEQILKIDFKEIEEILKKAKNTEKIDLSTITPIDYVDKEKLSSKEKEKYEKIGEKIIKNNQYAVVTMAGGQGTRLGYNGPKGTYKLNIGENGKYIFEILAENLEKSKKLYNILPFWYIMTSRQNHNETVEFFEKNNFFGYDKEKVEFFSQGELPIVTKEGKIVIENNQIKTGSNGNGGVYQALKDNNIINEMKEKNIKWVYFCGVDNIMVNPIDALLLGITIDKNMPVASKSIVKAYPDERVGVFCKKNGRPSTIEYIDMNDKMKNERDENGELVYGEGNFVSHLLNINSVEKISNQKLKYHIAEKNNLYKFEAFIFDGFEYLDDMLVMRVNRDDEFAPIKNKEGKDSPETAKEIYEKKQIKQELNLKNFLDVNQTIASNLFENTTYPWEVIPKISEYIIKLGESLSKEKFDKKSENIWIAKNAKVDISSHIDGPCIIDENTTIRPFAYIRGNVIVGKDCVVGNSTELKNSIIFNNVQVPHYNCVGDSILGYKSHMGAGSIISNLKSDKTPVTVKINERKIETNLRKFGAILGDNVEVGCGAVLNPGTIIGRKTNIYPLSSVRGYVKPNKIYKNKNEIIQKNQK